MQVQENLSENTRNAEEDIDATKDIDIRRKNINRRYSTLEQELSTLKNAYPSYQISEQYIQDNLNIFPIGTSFTEMQQRAILTYKYILEQIIAEKTASQQSLTSYERTLITNFNTFCFDIGIKSQIELPKTESISSVRDIIDNDNL